MSSILELVEIDESLGNLREFDCNVPVTVTWFLPEPIYPLDYALVVHEQGCLEFKFQRETHLLHELVLITYPSVEIHWDPLEPTFSEKLLAPVRSCCLNQRLDENDRVKQPFFVHAYPDYLVIILDDKQINSWVGSDPILFGLNHDGTPEAIAIQWSPQDQAETAIFNTKDQRF